MKQIRHKIMLVVVLTLSINSFGQLDPGLPGIYDVSNDEYDFGPEAFDAPTFPDLIEVTGSVHYPTDLADGPFPVIVLLHGRHSTCYNPGSGGTSIAWPCNDPFLPIPSYAGYDYLGEQMASHGYIVISVSANSISSTDNTTPDFGMRARGELIQHHLDLWNEWNTTDSGPFGDTFIGKLDLDRIGTMGHSRGGEGVIEHALYNRELGDPYGIKAVLTLAPVDFNRPVLNGIPIMNIAPYCDGDVSDLQGVHFYDDSRYIDLDDTMPKHNLLMLGGNHNYYNTVWTPGLFPAGTADDWRFVDPGQSDEHCGTDVPDNGRMDPETQRNALKAYSSAFFRLYVGGETDFEPILKVTDVAPPVSATLDPDEVFMSYHAPSNRRVDINRTDAETTESENTLGEIVSESGLTVFDICGDDFGEQFCIGAAAGANQEPHNKNGGVSMLGLSQMEIEWNSPDDWFRNDIPDFLQDFTQFQAIQFRTAVNFNESPDATILDFNVQVADNSGEIASLPVSAYSEALFFPPGDFGTTLPRTMHNTISIPIEDFSGVDITDIAYVRFAFNVSVNGAILVSDLALVADEIVVFPPIAAFEANVTETCTGEINFTDNSTFSPDTWAWDFGDGETSDEANPAHTYLLDGTYTVSLTVSNTAGTDSETITAYIVVDRPDAPTAEDVIICGEGDVTLNATALSGGTLNWYADETSDIILETGESFTTSITATTPFYVQESVPNAIQSVGPEDNTFGAGGNFGANDLRGIFFDAMSPFILESVRVYAQGSGTRTIQILDGDGGDVVHTTNVFIPNGESIVDLGFEVGVGEGYYMKVTGALVDLFRINDGSPTYPYTIDGLVSLTGSNVGGAELDFYYFFFDWKVREPDCLSSRTLVTATVGADITVTASDDVTIASGETTVLTASGGAEYEWSPTTALSTPLAATTDASPTVTTTYTVSVKSDEGCVVTDSVVVTVDGQLGIDDENLGNFTIHPNPSTGVITININAIEYPYNVEVFTVDGKTVYNEENAGENEIKTIDLSGLSKGIYYVKVSNKDNSFKEKIILQ